MAETMSPRRRHAEGDWAAAFEGFSAASATTELCAEDNRALAESAWWLGRIDDCIDAYTRAHKQFVATGQLADAAMAAFFLGLHSQLRGDMGTGNGWLRRCEQHLAEIPEQAAHGYPHYVATYRALGNGDTTAAIAHARSMHDAGKRWKEPNLIAMGLLGEGRTLIRLGRVDDGMRLLDDAMLAASSGDLAPFWAGAIYCHLMDVCNQLIDLRRARECTQTAEQWCHPLPDASLYPGICRVHRAQVLLYRGKWANAEQEAGRVCVDALAVHTVSAAEGFYQIGEIHRLRGDFAGAERSLRRAHELGVTPQPALAMLRLAQGRADQAAASIRTARAAEGSDPLARARLDIAQVDIALAVDDVATARAAADELTATASAHGSSGLRAFADRASGAVLLAEGDASTALQVLQRACRAWSDIDVPYEAARTRALLADAYRALGDEDAVALELGVAASIFERLGAAPDLRSVHERQATSRRPGNLSVRELEVLRLLASGATNRQIAGNLFLSERTVHRHVSSIFTKLDVRTRSAATAFAHKHGFVDG